MRKLAFDLTYQPVGGSLSHINSIIDKISIYTFDEITFYVAKDNMHLLKGVEDDRVTISRLIFSKNSLILRTIWTQIILPFFLIINHIDVLFCTGNISPIINSKKKVQWIGTVGPFEKDFITSFSLKQRFILLINKYLIIFSSYTSNMTVFESNYTRDLFVNKYKFKIEKSVVFNIGKDSYYHPVEKNHRTVSNKYNDVEFILTVSHLYPYKNIELLLASFHSLKLHKRGLTLLVAGSIVDEKYFDKLNSLTKKHEISANIIFLGRVGKKDLRELYSQCKIFVFTSPYENFAYTLVEAMSCSAPIITTNTTAMPETCGSAALYYAPDSDEQLSECLLSFLNDENKRLKYKQKSLNKIKEYLDFVSINRKTNEILGNLVINNLLC